MPEPDTNTLEVKWVPPDHVDVIVHLYLSLFFVRLADIKWLWHYESSQRQPQFTSIVTNMWHWIKYHLVWLWYTCMSEVVNWVTFCMHSTDHTTKLLSTGRCHAVCHAILRRNTPAVIIMQCFGVILFHLQLTSLPTYFVICFFFMILWAKKLWIDDVDDQFLPNLPILILDTCWIQK